MWCVGVIGIYILIRITICNILGFEGVYNSLGCNCIYGKPYAVKCECSFTESVGL